MSKSNAYETQILELLFNATAIPNVADNASVAPLTELYVSLHTASPGEAGDQSTNEIAYTGYARVAVARTSGGWTVTNNSVSPNADITFGEMTGGAGGTVTHAAVGSSASGGGQVYYYGTVTPNINVTTGVTPKIASGSTITED